MPFRSALLSRPALGACARSWMGLLALVFVFTACAPRATPPVTPAETAPVAVFPFTPEAPPAFRSEGLRLATLNTEFLFDGLGEEGGATFPHKGDPALARAHRARIAAILRTLDADVVMLEEVENEAVLAMMLEEQLADMGYGIHFIEGQDSFTGQDVALLSRLPVEAIGRTDERVQVVGEDRMQGVSKNMYARLRLGDLPVTLIGVHFYARPTDPERKPRREAQAEVIRQLAVAEMAAGRAVAILGDFNDYDDATPDLGDNQPISNVLARLKAAGPGPDDDLRNVIADVPQYERFTAHWDRDRNDTVDEGEFTAIDHILLSPLLYERLREAHYVQAHNPLDSPDHFPIVVTLDFPAGVPGSK